MKNNTTNDKLVATSDRLVRALWGLKHDQNHQVEIAEYEHFASTYGGALSKIAGEIICEIAASKLQSLQE